MNKRELLILIAQLGFSRERNLTVWDVVRLLSEINGLTNAQINFWSLDKTRAGEEVTLPDGSKAFKVQKEFLDGVVRSLYKDTDVLKEGIIWVVINKTDHPGLAAQAARLIDNIGGEVVAFYDKEESKTSGIYCWEEKICRSYSAKLLSQSFNLKIKKERFQETSAEAMVVLDEDYWSFFYQR